MKRASDDEGAENWFQDMYVQRSRAADLASTYLLSERAFMTDFAERHQLTGPSLEIGCGSGMFADTLLGYIGMEYSLQSLTLPDFQEHDRVCADARWLPFADANMQVIFSFNTLEHVPSVDLAFAEIDRVVAPHGFIILRPAWHCARYVTELIPQKRYRELNFRQKLVKLMLPVIKSRAYKLATRLPGRMWRELTTTKRDPLKYGTLIPYHGADWVADADAVASIDSHEGIMYFTKRGYRCLSHPTMAHRLLAGHDLAVFQKTN